MVKGSRSGRESIGGRNYCTLAQRVLVTPERRNTAPYTPRKSVTKTTSRKNHILTHAERVECAQKYGTWVQAGRKKGESPIPALKLKFAACRHPAFFTRLVKRNFDTGSITPAKPVGRRGVYDQAIIAPLIKQRVDVARALQNVADAPSIRRFLLSKGISPAPSEQWIIDHKKARALLLDRAPWSWTPFLILDRAPCHTSNATTLELNRVFGEDGWMFQAVKMPDANDGDVGVFPFMKRKVGELGGATTRDEIVTVVKRAWEKVTPQVCARIRKRVLRNCSWVALNGGRNYYDESMTKRDLGL